ncbi:MAG: diaminopimelate dehydrogenase [Oscillospiraceae bacterium]|nr:diaminopimelate dehydrogenase [Oscillospiraceae bacterium]
MGIRIGIVGYGNIGKGVEKAVRRSPDMELAAVLTRRDPRDVVTAAPVAVYPLREAEGLIGKVDVMALCGGSAKDLPEQGPAMAAMFCTVDSYDNHTEMMGYLGSMRKAVKSTTSVIAAGWDPGLFSLMRALSGAVLPSGEDYTFWGYGVSQGHSEAIRGIEGVAGAVQYTVPSEEAVALAMGGTNPRLSAAQRHTRLCYVSLREGADPARVEREIKGMPHYFSGYETTVRFVSDETLRAEHGGIPHAGQSIRSGDTGGNRHLMNLSLKMDSNPEFTASVIVAYARAAARMCREGILGVKTVLDVPISYLSPKDPDGLVREIL